MEEHPNFKSRKVHILSSGGNKEYEICEMNKRYMEAMKFHIAITQMQLRKATILCHTVINITAHSTRAK